MKFDVYFNPQNNERFVLYLLIITQRSYPNTPTHYIWVTCESRQYAASALDNSGNPVNIEKPASVLWLLLFHDFFSLVG